MKTVYFCHPYANAPEENTAAVFEAAKVCREIFPDILPIVPHLYLPKFFDEATQREQAMDACVTLLSTCSEVWVFVTPHGTTKGMQVEVDAALESFIPVREVAVDIKAAGIKRFTFYKLGSILAAVKQ